MPSLLKTLSILTILIMVSVFVPQLTRIISIQPAIAQSTNSRNISQQVYEKIPELPKENQYVSKENGKVVSDNTLVSRMVNYHYYQKGRAPNYRFDWKLTIADYLGANEIIYDSSYPGHDTLRQNPLAGDQAAIQKLNRRQRNALIQTLVNIFSTSQ